MSEERTSRCGWDVLTLARRQQGGSGAVAGLPSWLNIINVEERDQQGGQQGEQRHSCERLGGLDMSIDEILESPLETVVSNSAESQPFIQSTHGHCVLPGGYRAEPLHLFHTVRNRKHVLHCYEYLLMRTLEDDPPLWEKLCQSFGTCDQCLVEMGTSRSPQHSHFSQKGKDPFSINSIHPDLWFLAITLKESKDKLIHFIRSESLPKRKEEIHRLQKPFSSSSFLSSYLSSFNFVEMYLDSIFKFGEATVLPRELFKCSNVKTLSLRNNFLDTLPPDIGRLSKLEKLFLTNNKLQNKSIPFTLAFCGNLSELYIDNNLLDALPGILLLIQSLERVHRHGNHNYFKATFMWYHTDINDRILECCAEVEPARLTTPSSLQKLAATSAIRARINFYQSAIPSRIKDYLSLLCEGIELCSNCSKPGYKTSSSFKVFTFKNPYLGNTCVPFQHWACSLSCARAVEIPARREQLSQAEVQDREYEREVSGMVRSVNPTMSLLDKILRREIRRFHQNVDRLSPVLGTGAGPGHLPPDLASSVLSSRRSLALSCPHQYQAKLSPPEVTNLLKGNEYTNANLPYGPVKSFDTNTLQSNNPIEDSQSQAMLNKSQGDASYLFGIFDGHGGASCGQVVAKRLFHYIAAGLLASHDLSDHITSVTNVPAKDFFEKPGYSLIKNFNDHFGLVQDLRDLYYETYKEHLKKLHSKQVELGSTENLVNVEEILINSFLSLDNDMSMEAQRRLFNESGELRQINMKTATVAMSGCVAVAAYIDGPHLSIASTGDCTAVVGSLSDTDTWLAKKLTSEHNSDNQKEVKRILSEHPENEHHHIIKGDRLLSILAPLRAFGDFKFKWDRNTIEETLGVHLGEHACPPNYKTPPYLTARPDITHHRLSPRDKFLVLGSDGLWDMMTPMQVVRLVGEHMSGKTTLSPLQLSDNNIPLKDIAEMLKKRQDAMRVKPTDVNAATHLIRNALGGTAYGVDHSRLSQMLSLPQDMVRMFRDDITIHVVFFDEEYLRTC